MRRRFVFTTLSLLLAGATLLPAQPAPNARKEKREKFRPVARDMADRPTAEETQGNVRFEGGKLSFTDAQLREPLATSLKEIQAEGLTRPRADDAAYFLGVFYRKQGFPEAEITFDIRGSQLVLKVKEGRRIYLEKIIFHGNKTQTTEDLYEYMIGETGERLLRQPQRFPFVEADMQTGVARLRGLYESVGRLTTQVQDATFTPTGRDGMIVHVNITEGPQFRFGTITFAGPGRGVLPRETLLKALSNPTGEPPPDTDEKKPTDLLAEPFTVQGANTLQHNLLYFLKLKGYYDAKVEVHADPGEAGPLRKGVRLVPVRLTLTPGPLYRFDGIKVTGLERLKLRFLENRFSSLSGQIYNPTLLDEKYREVLRTGIFKTLRLSTVPLPSHEVRVDLEVEEAKSKEVGFSLGFSSYEGAIAGLRLADRNFAGNGRPLSLDIDYSTRAMRGELLYVDPWWLESNFALRASIFIQTREEEGFSYNQTGIRAGLTRKFTPKLELTGFLQAKTVDITESEIDPLFLGASSYQIGTIGFTQTFDFRDNPVNPSKGWVLSLGVDGDTIASEVAFARSTLRFSYYLPIQKKYLLALGARGGIIYPLTSVPIPERFFNGGSTTVRSFQERELGPKDPNGYPIGGEAFTVFNAEFIIPLKDALALAVFADAGNLFARLQDAGFNDMRYAVGLGLRYKLPIGPVRLDVGLNPQPKRDEDWGAVHFSFGFAF